MDASEYLDKGRFACSVFAKKRIDKSSRLQLQVDLAEREGRAKGLGDVAQLQEGNAA